MVKLVDAKSFMLVCALFIVGVIFTDSSSAEYINTYNLSEKGSFSVSGSATKNNTMFKDKSDETLVAMSALSPIKYNIANQTPLVTDEWQFIITPYMWLAGLNGTLTARGQEVDVDASFGDIFDQLDFAFQIHAEAMKNRYFFFLDWTFVKLSIDEEITPKLPLPVGGSLDIGVTQNLLDFGGGYRLTAPNPQVPVYLDLYVGGRLWNVDMDQDIKFNNLPNQSVDQSKTWVDPIIGARIIALLTDNIIVNVKSDIGGFDIGSSSKFTWNITANIGYDTGWHGVTPFIGWRTLYVDYDDGSGSDFYEYKIWMNGIQTGLGFRF